MLDNQIYLVLKFLGITSGVVLLVLLCYLLIEIIMTVRAFRKIVDRVELLTDIKGWLTLSKIFSRSKSKK